MGAYAKAFLEALRPDPSLTISEWADRYRILPSKGAAEPGRFRTSRTPYLREIMDCLSPQSPVQKIIFQKSSQVGGTEMGLNWLGYVIHMAPAPMMVIQPDLILAERFSKQRIAPMIEATPELAELISPARSRDSGNTTLLKEFRGGLVVISGANSGASLRQMPIRYLFADEISAYGVDADGEGDPVSLAEKRTQTFGVRSKVFLNSTPKTKDVCRIEREYLRTDQRKFFVPCPHCGGMQHLEWKQVKWEEGRPDTVHYVCKVNGCTIEEYHKTKFLAAGEWRATASSGSATVRGYHINGLYSPLGWKSWAAIVIEFLEAVEAQRSGDQSLLKAFVNSILAETWEDAYAAKIGAETLESRVEAYEPGVAPEQSLVLTAGVDVQDNRFAVSVYAWGRDEESWVVSHMEIFGDPAQGEIWKQLDNVLLGEYRHALGGKLKIRAAAIDTGGHFTHEAYQYARSRKANGVIAIKGASQKGKPALSKPSKQDVDFRGKALKYGVDLYMLGVDTIKGTIYGRLKIEKPGPGFIHFHGALETEFFNQLTAERQVVKYIKGFAIKEWEKKAGARNEALDCAVYAYAALQYLYTRFNRKTFWEQLERTLEVGSEKPATQSATPEPEKKPPPPDEKLPKPGPNRSMGLIRRPGGFIKTW